MHFYLRLGLIGAGSHHVTVESSQTEGLWASMVWPRGVLIVCNKPVLIRLKGFESSRKQNKKQVY